MGGESHRESSIGLPRNSHDTENPAIFDPKPSDTEKYGRVQIERSHPESGAVMDNVLRRSRAEASLRSSGVDSPPSPTSSSDSSSNVNDQGSCTFASPDGQGNITNATSSSAENKGQQLGKYHAEIRGSNASSSRNRNEVVNATWGRNNQGLQCEVFDAGTGSVDFSAGGPWSIGSRARVSVRGAHFDMVSPRPNRETGYQDDEPPPQKSPSPASSANSTAE